MGDERKVREARLRRMAARRGLVLRKARRRDPGALDYGMYWLSGPGVDGACGWDGLDAVEEFLGRYDARAVPARYLLPASQATEAG
jgi:hypothetical protein